MSVGVGLWDDLLQGEELAYLGSEAPREARSAPLPDDLPAPLRERLEVRGIVSLYSHQAEAWETARRGVEIAADTTRRSADTAAEIAGRSADAARDAGKRTIEAAAQTGKAGMEALERVGDKSREALRSAAYSARRGNDELASKGTDGLDAMAASSRALFDTMQELHREWLSFTQAQFSESIEVGREFARCRSPKDLLELQMRYTRSSADRILTEATKLAELSVRVASASLQPLQARAGFAERPRS